MLFLDGFEIVGSCDFRYRRGRIVASNNLPIVDGIRANHREGRLEEGPSLRAAAEIEYCTGWQYWPAQSRPSVESPVQDFPIVACR